MDSGLSLSDARADNIAQASGESFSITPDLFEQMAVICERLPEVMVRVHRSAVASRSTAYSFDVRRKSFALLLAVRRGAGVPIPQLIVRVDPSDRDSLVAVGRPFFPSRLGHDRIRIRLDGSLGWEEATVFVIESYRLTAPAKLAESLDRD
jgi:hypothetical protein